MKTTGKYSIKPYRCRNCGNESNIGTNHWGEVYSRCNNCAWYTPYKAPVHECLVPPPDGVGIPPPWRIVALSEIAEIK
jgi:hypothetical protein